jgi:mono/diheme cytochrome c family protein
MPSTRPLPSPSNWRLLRAAPARRRLLSATLAGLFFPAACVAQDAVRGAALYLRLDNDTRSCVSCHGPDPGQSHNNILRAADSPDTLTKVLNTVSAMGFLRSQLSDADRADIASYLGSVVEMNQAASTLRAWPATLEFGRVAPGQSSAAQFVRITNASATQALALPDIQVSDRQLRAASDCPPRLNAGASCDIKVRMAPQGVGLVRGALVIASQDLARARIIGGVGQGAAGPLSALRWQGGAQVLRFEPSSTTSEVRSLTLENPGPMPVVLAASSITGPQASQFRIDGGCSAGQVLQAGTSCALRIVYTASALPLAQAALQIRSDHANPDALRLEGLAVAQAPSDAVATESGGGCSIGPPSQRDRWDPTLVLTALLALAAARRHRRNR